MAIGALDKAAYAHLALCLVLFCGVLPLAGSLFAVM
jgi:hypothetical protein